MRYGFRGEEQLGAADRTHRPKRIRISVNMSVDSDETGPLKPEGIDSLIFIWDCAYERMAYAVKTGGTAEY